MPKIRTTPINEMLHELLTLQGYKLEMFEADWEDVGGCESGPKLTGGPEFDEYMNDRWRIIVDHKGKVAMIEEIDPIFEAFLEEMAREWGPHCPYPMQTDEDGPIVIL